MNRSSPSTPSFRGTPPVATIAARAVNRFPFFRVTDFTSPARSTSAMRAKALISQPKSRACCAIACDRSRPDVVGTPG